MGLRNRSSLKRQATGGGGSNGSPPKSERTRRRTALKSVAVKLVSSDPALVQFLRATPSPLSKNSNLPDNASPNSQPLSVAEQQEVAAAKVERAVSSLGKLEAEVIEALFPAAGGEPETFEDLGSRLGMTVEEVKSLADSALRSLRGARRNSSRLSTVWN